MSNQSTAKKQLDIISGYLRSPGKLYTGTAIKRYIKANILALKPGFTSKAIDSGRWAAYCHFDLVQSVSNLLDKNQINDGSSIIVHPLTPPKVVDLLLSRSLNIATIDINKSTLAWEAASLAALVEKNKPACIINYSDNGLVGSLVPMLSDLENLALPVITILDNPGLNTSVFEYLSSLGMGSVIINWGKDFWGGELNQIAGIEDAKSRNWYLSWHHEMRIRSILEYSLKDSHQVYQPILEGLEYLLIQKVSKTDWTVMAMQAGKKIAQAGTSLEWKELFANKFKTPREAKDLIQNKYPDTLNMAVPDVVFDLNLISRENLIPVTELNYQYQITAKKWQEYFLSRLSGRQTGTLEIPTFYLNQGYLKYFVYTTEPEFWQGSLAEGKYKILKGKNIHPFFTSDPKLPNANFIASYCFSIDLGGE